MLLDTLFYGVSILSCLLTLLTIYMVLFHSPKSMEGYKIYVVNFTAWDFLFSFTLGILVRPTPMYPLLGSHIEGWLRYLGDFGATLSLILIINTAGYCLSSQALCLVYRFVVLQNLESWTRSLSSRNSWIYAYLGSFCVSILSYFIFSGIQPTQEEVHSLLIHDAETTPHAVLPNFTNTVIMYTNYKSENAGMAAIFIFVGFFTAEFVSIGCIFMLLRMLEAKKDHFSVMTYKLHRQLTIALGVQLITPLLFIILPVSYGIIQTYRQALTQETGRLMIDFIELYGFTNSLVTLYFVKPYRNLMICKLKRFVGFLTCAQCGNTVEVTKAVVTESTIRSSRAFSVA